MPHSPINSVATRLAPTCPPLPVGARPEDANDWQPAVGSVPGYRCVSTPVAAVAGVEVRGVVVQWADGTVAADGNDRPRVFLDDTQYDLDEARALADAIRAAADLAESWAARPTSSNTDRSTRP